MFISFLFHFGRTGQLSKDENADFAHFVTLIINSNHNNNIKFFNNNNNYDIVTQLYYH